MTRRSLPLSLALVLCLGFVATARAELLKAPAQSWDTYKVLSERNIFLRDRSRPDRRTAPPAPVYPPEHFILLRGIVRQGDQYIAFLEDTRNRTTSKARVNDPVAQGRIAHLALDYLEYEKNNKTVKVEMGKTLEGPAMAGPSVESSSPAIAAPVESSGTSGQGSALERMRQRRQQELNTR